MPPTYAVRSTLTPQVIEEGVCLNCATYPTTSNTSKQILQPQKKLKVCLRLLEHYPVMHPGSGCAGIHSTQTRLTASCQEHDESCLDDHSDMNNWPRLPADFSMPICLLTSAGIPAKSSRHSFLFRSYIAFCSSNSSAFSRAGMLLDRTCCRMSAKSMFLKRVLAAVEEHKSKAVHCCLND